MLMFGIDPDRVGIRHLLVDGQSLANEATGFLRDDTATFRTGCPNLGGDDSPAGCEEVFWIRIHPDSGNMSIGMEMRNSLKKIQSYNFEFIRMPEDLQ